EVQSDAQGKDMHRECQQHAQHDGAGHDDERRESGANSHAWFNATTSRGGGPGDLATARRVCKTGRSDRASAGRAHGIPPMAPPSVPLPPEPVADADPDAEVSYSYKPSLLGSACTFALTPEGLSWRAG